MSTGNKTSGGKYTNKYASNYCLKRHCAKKSYSRSLCKTHYTMQKKYGRPLNDNQKKVEKKLQNTIRVYKNYIVLLASGKEVIVDNEPRIIRLVLRKKWYVTRNGYAMSGHIYLHHYLHGKSDQLYIDHINRNKLDNRTKNVRLATPRQNTWNYTPNNKSGVKGVSWDSKTKSWRVFVDKKHYGRFKDIEEASATAYLQRHIKYGQFA